MGLDVQLLDLALRGAMARYGDFCIHAVIDASRTFEEQALQDAYEATLRAFPVLAHRYVSGFMRDRWEPVRGGATESVVFEDVDTEEALRERTEHWIEREIDSTRERQLRLVVLRRGGETRLLLSIMHLAVDGAGVGAVGHVFGSALYGLETKLPVETRRDVWRTFRALSLRHAPVLAYGLARSTLVPWKQLRAGARSVPYAASPKSKPVHHEMTFDRETVASLRERCKGASINDLLVSAFARASAERSDHGPAVVTYTMDLRRYGGVPALIAANTSGILSAIVPREELGSFESTVRAVRRITKAHREELHGPAIVLGLYALGSVMPHRIARSFAHVLAPVLVDLPLSRGLMMTNVGRIDDGLAAFGDDVKALTIVGPTIENIPVPLVVAYGFRGAVQFSFYAPRGIPKSALETLERELRRAIA